MKKFSVKKSHFDSKSTNQLQIRLNSGDKIILLKNNQTCQNQFYNSRINFVCYKRETKNRLS